MLEDDAFYLKIGLSFFIGLLQRFLLRGFCMKKWLLIALFQFLAVLSSWANLKTPEVIQTFDVRTYSPVNYSLKDLTFEIRLKKLTDIVKKRLVDIKIEEVFFKVYWVFPGRFDIQVEGMPKGFHEIKNELKTLVINRLDYVVPQKLMPKLRSYQLKESKTSRGTLVIAADLTQQKSVNEIKMFFDKGGKLVSFNTSSPAGAQKSKMVMSPKSWSHNKWVVDRVVSRSIAGIQTTKIENDIKYFNKDGFGFPQTISILTTQKIQAPSPKARPQERQVRSTINFSNYRVNSGEAKKYFRKFKSEK